jgi:hypothetical protein
VETSYVDISNAMIPTALRGSTTTSPPIVIVILRQQLDYIIIDYICILDCVYATSNKS